MKRAKAFLKNCRRVFKITRKPSREEYEQAIKLTALGMTVIGGIGFLVQMLAMMLGI